MGKIYDALEKFNREKVKRPSVPEASPEVKTAGETPVLDAPGCDIKIESLPLADAPGRNIEIEGFPQDQHAAYGLDERLVTVTDPQSLAAEQFKMLRSRILYPRNGSIPRTIMVASAMEEEGKSLISANLAISIAQGIQEHVLLVDCDIRRPAQHLLFNVSGEHGLSDYLTSDVPLEDLFIKTDIDKLTLLPGGMPPPNPSELLSSEKMGRFIEEVKNRYHDRFIVFDCTPAQITSEVSVLAKSVDGILMVVRRGKTDRDIIKRSVSALGRDKIIGVVFNGFTHFSREYEYYRSYKYRG
ncbi:MAG: polysaccharide biosynthesis tyrosine autokinase [Thermodesulfobacteriota bacterium]|nr:polysaccharide biosynthesis tyrosine autokinase [Thermodesulfobacteriota bacterium]